MQRFVAAFAGDLAELEFGPLPPELRQRVAEWVALRVAGAGDVTRIGLGVVCAAVALWVRVRSGRAYAELDTRDRRAWEQRIARSGLPGVSELVRAVRSLAVAYVYDARFASAP